MLVCNVSMRPLRRAIAAELAEAVTALDDAGTGTVVFAALVDDPASVREIVDAYLGEIMLEAASAMDSISTGAIYDAAIVEAVTASSAQDATAISASIPPSFVNAGSIAGSLSGTSAVATMPASLVAGNLLIAEVQVFGANAVGTFSCTAGWTIGDQVGAGSNSAAWAWKISNGGEASVNFLWTGGAGYHTKCIQISGNAASPIGAVAHNAAASGTAFTVGGITTTHAQSFILGMALGKGNTSVAVSFSTPSGYTSRSAFNDQYATDDLCSQTVATSGGTSSNLNTTLSYATDWQGFLIEVKGP